MNWQEVCADPRLHDFFSAAYCIVIRVLARKSRLQKHVRPCPVELKSQELPEDGILFHPESSPDKGDRA